MCIRESKSLHKCCYSSELMEPQVKIRLPVGVFICFVKPWLELFGTNLHLVSFEKYTTSQIDTLLEIFRFLDLPFPPVSTIETILSEAEVGNKGESHAPMLNKTRELLTYFYRPYNEMLFSLTGEPAFLFEKWFDFLSNGFLNFIEPVWRPQTPFDSALRWGRRRQTGLDYLSVILQYHNTHSVSVWVHPEPERRVNTVIRGC